MSHTTGSPISQRLNDGFNWPPFPVATLDPLAGLPGGRASLAASVSVTPGWCVAVRSCVLPVLSLSFRVGVGHEEDPVTTVRGTDARSRQDRRPDGVACSFQVSVNKVEPRPSSRARNLLSKDDWRAALLDEAEPGGPEVAGVVEGPARAGLGERLTGAAPRPDRSVVGPAGEAEGVGPDADAGEGVELNDILQVLRSNVCDAARVDEPPRDVSAHHEVSHPLRGEGLNLVVDDTAERREVTKRGWHRCVVSRHPRCGNQPRSTSRP